jgi:hypothetical protein
MMKNNEYAELEKRLFEALAGCDAKEYARLCQALGRDIEDQELYSEGAAILSHEKEQEDIKELAGKQQEFERTLARRIPNEKYAAFIFDSKGRKVNVPDLFSDTVQKRSLLFKFFPEDFAPGKPRDLRFRGAHAVGTIFKGVIGYAKRRMREKRIMARAKKARL